MKYRYYVQVIACRNNHVLKIVVYEIDQIGAEEQELAKQEMLGLILLSLANIMNYEVVPVEKEEFPDVDEEVNLALETRVFFYSEYECLAAQDKILDTIMEALYGERSF